MLLNADPPDANYNFDVTTADEVTFEIQNFSCLTSPSYSVSCDVGDEGFISLEGTTISVDWTERGSSAPSQVAQIKITASNSQSFVETFTMTSFFE